MRRAAASTRRAPPGRRCCAGRRRPRRPKPRSKAVAPRVIFWVLRHFDALGKRAEMVAAVTAVLSPHALFRRPGELADHLRRDRLFCPEFSSIA